MGYYAVSSANLLPTFRDNISVPSLGSFSLDYWTPKMGRIGCPETSVINYQYSLRKPEERSSHNFLLLLLHIQMSFTLNSLWSQTYMYMNNVVKAAEQTTNMEGGTLIFTAISIESAITATFWRWNLTSIIRTWRQIPHRAVNAHRTSYKKQWLNTLKANKSCFLYPYKKNTVCKDP